MNRWFSMWMFGMLAAVATVSAAEWRYVRSREVGLWAAPSFAAAVVGRLHRGDRVELLGTQGRWAHLRARDGEGWAPQLVLGEAPPPEPPAMGTDGPNPEPGARRRASALVGTGATRGLRGETGRERLDSLESPDYEALERWEEEAVPAGELDSFGRALREGQAE